MTWSRIFEIVTWEDFLEKSQKMVIFEIDSLKMCYVQWRQLTLVILILYDSPNSTMKSECKWYQQEGMSPPHPPPSDFFFFLRIINLTDDHREGMSPLPQPWLFWVDNCLLGNHLPLLWMNKQNTKVRFYSNRTSVFGVHSVFYAHLKWSILGRELVWKHTTVLLDWPPGHNLFFYG